MPSLFGRRPGVVSDPALTNREPIAPVPENYEGFNIPYRGTELHGVEPTADPRAVPGHASGREVVYDEPLPDPDPIPVVIVNTGSRELRRSRIYQSSANVGAPTQIVGRDERRILCKVKNLGASDVYIGHDDNVANANHGWPVRQHEVYESETQDVLYAMSSSATDVMPVAVTVIYAAELT